MRTSTYHKKCILKWMDWSWKGEKERNRKFVNLAYRFALYTKALIKERYDKSVYEDVMKIEKSMKNRRLK